MTQIFSIEELKELLKKKKSQVTSKILSTFWESSKLLLKMLDIMTYYCTYTIDATS